MAPGDPERPDRPDYNVYRAGSGGRGRKRRADQPSKSAPQGGSPSRAESGGPDEASDYKVYKSRRRFAGASALGSVRERLGRGDGDGGGKPVRADSDRRITPRRVLKWSAIALGAWLLLSLVLFGISAQIQKGKLDNAAADQLGGFPLMVASAQTILVIGTDARPEGTDEAGAETNPKCLERAATGAPTANLCASPARADTLMLVRAGGGAFQKLSIPRDTYAAIGGQDSQKINAAYAFGGAKLEIQTVEDLLGIDVDHVVILDFAGFAEFIDSVGGVQVALREPVKSKISGGTANGGVSLDLPKGKVDLNGQEALALARTRENLKCDGSPDQSKQCGDTPPGDEQRAKLQQAVLAGIQGRLTSPTRIPYNLIHAPWIAWNAPKAMVSDMGALTLPQLAVSAAIGGSSDTQILKPSGMTDSGALIVARKECERAVKQFLGKEGPRTPQCSPS